MLAVTALDCQPDQADAACEVIGRALTRLWTDVPPGEVRAVNGKFTFANLLKPRGQLRLTQNVSDVEAK